MTRRGNRDPTLANVRFGKKMRTRRLMLGSTQTELGVATNVTFQQIQKYEKRRSRVCANMLEKRWWRRARPENFPALPTGADAAPKTRGLRECRSIAPCDSVSGSQVQRVLRHTQLCRREVSRDRDRLRDCGKAGERRALRVGSLAKRREGSVPELLRRFVYKEPKSNLEGLREIIWGLPMVVGDVHLRVR